MNIRISYFLVRKNELESFIEFGCLLEFNPDYLVFGVRVS